jgi:Cu(I)/Ag(I) efflux system membrane fusion protein
MRRISLVVALLLAGGCFARQGSPSNEIDGVTQDATGRRVVGWIDPMYAMGPPHAYKAKHPGIAPDCGMKLEPLYAEGGAAKPAAAGYAEVTIPAERQRLAGVKLATVERRDLSRTARAAARIAVDERRITQVHARIDGYVESLYVNVTGQVVHRGEPLLAFYSPELLATQQELILAEREKTELGRSLAQSARTRLLRWDMQPEDIEKVSKSGQPMHDVVFRSPATGVVMGKSAVAGARVSPGDTLFEIADLSRVWALAEVYETELAFLHVGSRARVTVAGTTVSGRVSFIDPVVQSATRTVKVRVELDNGRAILKPDMYAEVLFDEPIGRVVAVPDGAVMQTGTRAVVLVARDDRTFEPRQIETGAKGDGFYEVRAGLRPGESVVAEANFLIDSESRLKSALAQLNGSQP